MSSEHPVLAGVVPVMLAAFLGAPGCATHYVLQTATLAPYVRGEVSVGVSCPSSATTLDTSSAWLAPAVLLDCRTGPDGSGNWSTDVFVRYPDDADLTSLPVRGRCATGGKRFVVDFVSNPE